jgi:hypothetical protein
MKTRLLFNPVAAAVLALTAGAAAHAGETIEFENGAKLEWRVNANYTLAQRMKSPDAVLAANAAGNDGNNNFAKNSLTANRLALLFESKLSKGDSGFVLSGSTFYDDVYTVRTTILANSSASRGRSMNSRMTPNAITEATAEFLMRTVTPHLTWVIPVAQQFVWVATWSTGARPCTFPISLRRRGRLMAPRLAFPEPK